MIDQLFANSLNRISCYPVGSCGPLSRAVLVLAVVLIVSGHCANEVLRIVAACLCMCLQSATIWDGERGSCGRRRGMGGETERRGGERSWGEGQRQQASAGGTSERFQQNAHAKSANLDAEARCTSKRQWQEAL